MPNKHSDDWSAAWSARYESGATRRRRLRLAGRRGGGSRPGRYALATAAVLAVVGSPFAVAATSGGSFTNDSPRYTLLARNVRSGDGGAAATACTSNKGNEPCLNMVNKGDGYAAAFRTRGVQGFRLQTSGSGQATPFILDSNATGVVKYLNADTVDGKDSTEIGREPWAFITGDATPTVSRQSGGVTVTRASAGDYRVAFTNDVNTCSYQVTLADPTGNRTVSAIADPANTKQVRVVIKRAGGTNEGDPVDSAFQIAVHC